MSYELVILRKEWIFKNPSPDKYDVLTRLINKAYSKAMATYGIIQSMRVKSPDTFLRCLGLSPDKDCVLLLLLGSKKVFRRLDNEHGYVRTFDSDVWPLSGSHNSDLPPHLVEEFGPLTPQSVKIHTLAPDEDLDPSTLDRCLATMGLKEIQVVQSRATVQVEDAPVTISEQMPEDSRTTLKLELTAYTSFMSGGGAALLEFVITECLPNHDWFSGHVSSYTLIASVIKEHNLVPYYTRKCGFQAFEPEVVVQASGVDSPLELGVVASRDFTVTTLKREVSLQGTSAPAVQVLVGSE